MAVVEIDSFISKLKSLWALGYSATLHVETEAGKASVCLKADIGYLPPPATFPQRQHRGPSYQRRQARRRQNAQVNTVEGCEDAEEAAVANHVAVVADEVIDRPADKAADKMCDMTELN